MLSIIVWATGFPVAFIKMPAQAESENKYDATAVEADLGEIDLSKYPKDEKGEPELYSFMEYCYSDNAFRRSNYGIYLYIYNPAQLEFSSRSGASSVNMAVSYTEAGQPSEYKNLPLKVCGATVGEQERLFYKFRVLDAGELLTNAAKQSSARGARRYDVAGVQLLKKGEQNAVDYSISRTYTFTGYAAGCGEDSEAESNLRCEWSQLETISLDVHHTNYRVGSEYKENTRHELNSVYFSVPDKYITQYGNLQRIRAEWYEYKTSPIFVTADSGAYTALKDRIGVNIGKKDESLKWRILWDETQTGNAAGHAYHFGKDYNRLSDYDTWGTDIATINGENVSQIAWLFSTGGADYKNYTVSREAVENWAKTYCGKYGKTADVLDKYSSELFAGSIDADRVQYLAEPSQKRGYVLRDFDAGDEFNLLSYDDTHSGWQRFWDYFGNWNADSGGGKTYSPIEEVTAKNYTKDKGTDCSTLLLNGEDYTEFSSFCDTAFLKGEHPFLFRFAQTDYYSSAARYDYVTDNPLETGYSLSDQDGYIAQQTCFLNFDIIQLTFQKDGKDTVIAAVSNPIDIFNAVEPPIDKGGCDRDMIKKIIAIVILAVLVLILWRPIVWLIKNLFALIAAPFKAIGKAVKKKKKK